MIGLLRSWKLWAGLALVAGAAGVVAVGLDQAHTIGEQRAEMESQQALVESLGYQLQAQQRQHEKNLAARDAALVAEREHARAAQQRAKTLSTQINQERAANAELDACMGLQLPDSIAERLRQ
ncbi:hypothetical protein [Vreelandella janggokensis]|uniref:hypothetical protein n=1 Tax=Vreelandella janggokensis TaxID=370767 RepID=UPI00285C2A22|nr:hypothetical protein [Halomonas janggokensis]MDR5887549.1 hypothetical protein [Halomonas janggokensis]